MEKVKKILQTGSKTTDANNSLPEPSPEALADLKAKYTAAGQGHVLNFYHALSGPEKAALYSQLVGFNPSRVNEITKRALGESTRSDEGAPPAADTLEPLPDAAQASILDASAEDVDEWHAAGLHLIRRNKVAVVLMAGGQGTRLGSSAPKGCYDIGLPSHKSLFRIQAERIRRLEELAAKKTTGSSSSSSSSSPSSAPAVVPWYVMTSGPTHAPTKRFFQDNKYFGLDAANVRIFDQGVLPCVSDDGKMLLESKGRLAVAPDGNGGLYQALLVSGVLDDMRSRGIEHVHAYCVDNCLVRVADPVFIGFASSLDVDIATKVVRKRDASESVGLILCKNGRPDVVEYSEIDRATAEAEDPKQPGLLKFRAANIVNHYYSFRFLESIPRWVHKLPHHIARKKIPFADPESGVTVKPESPNGIKLEQFVFDVFPMLPLDKFACMEVRREDEFSPLKNAQGTGQDDPDTSKRDIMAQGQRWVAAAGATVVADGGVEVSPLISYGGEGLEKLKGTTITAPAVLERE